MARGSKKPGKTQSPVTPKPEASVTVSQEFIETLRKLHVSKHVLDAAEKAAKETGASEQVARARS